MRVIAYFSCISPSGSLWNDYIAIQNNEKGEGGGGGRGKKVKLKLKKTHQIK